MKNEKLYSACYKAVKNSLKVRDGEKVLLVTDRQKMEIAEALAFYIKDSGADLFTYLMIETVRPITEPPLLFREAIKNADVTIYLLEGRIEEKPFRAFMVKEGRESGRVLMMPGITVDMMERLVDIDFEEMRRRTRSIIERMKNSKEVQVKNHLGTDLRFSTHGRIWKEDIGELDKKGEYGNLPAGECFTCPIEESFNGRAVISLIDDIVDKGEMVFEKGRLVSWSGTGIERVVKNIGSDETGRMIGEFGIGTNPGARICANMLEAEKANGTIHIAIGDSYGLGINTSKHHYDALVEKATILADGKEILREGSFVEE